MDKRLPRILTDRTALVLYATLAVPHAVGSPLTGTSIQRAGILITAVSLTLLTGGILLRMTAWRKRRTRAGRSGRTGRTGPPPAA
ncbi:hypothetical protein GCM10009677_16880 [Sphaerisporangium rubeum]|uniref:Uncharacterized protein n=1 Tax=Sphaerisporangium rubeum TaxID=321317 RepID=A0A7X0IIG1_9ACTN|nr:hypothetical protein [Sphaerisporangium rubeum]MBB6475771.1 hypothetical protein [Sphaerisporangium rubeum]